MEEEMGGYGKLMSVPAGQMFHANQQFYQGPTLSQSRIKHPDKRSLMMIDDVLQGGTLDMTLQQRGVPLTNNFHKRNKTDGVGNNLLAIQNHARAGSAGMSMDYYNSSGMGNNTIDFGNYEASNRLFL